MCHKLVNIKDKTKQLWVHCFTCAFPVAVQPERGGGLTVCFYHPCSETAAINLAVALSLFSPLQSPQRIKRCWLDRSEDLWDFQVKVYMRFKIGLNFFTLWNLAIYLTSDWLHPQKHSWIIVSGHFLNLLLWAQHFSDNLNPKSPLKLA